MQIYILYFDKSKWIEPAILMNSSFSNLYWFGTKSTPETTCLLNQQKSIQSYLFINAVENANILPNTPVRLSFRSVSAQLDGLVRKVLKKYTKFFFSL